MQIFRVSKTKSKWFNLTKTYIYSMFLWGTFLWMLPLIIFEIEKAFTGLVIDSIIVKYLGTAIFLAFSVLNVYTGWTLSVFGVGTPLPLDTANKLVVVGPYQHLRNPMAIAGLGQGLGVALFLNSFFCILYVLLGGLLWNFLVRPIEESDLLDRFGGEYVHYKNHVRCWVPRIKPYSIND